MSGPSSFRFAGFEADVAAGELRRGGVRVRLQDLPFRMLVALAERPGQLVTREELQKALWPAESHGDFGHRLGGALNRLREALGDPADAPRIVETIPRRGYRFRAVLEPTGEREIAAGPPPIRARLRPRLMLAAAIVLAVSTGGWRLVPSSVAGQEPDPGGPYVVEGRLARDRSEVRVTVRLLDARGQVPLWTDSFEGDAADPVALEARVARAVAQAVRAQLSAP